jgi:hypothetical protein
MINNLGNLKSITYQTHFSLFRIIRDLYAREEIPTQSQINEWFKHTTEYRVCLFFCHKSCILTSRVFRDPTIFFC